ncbi:MAG: replicative helicase loader/inhibitor [Oscillospiraceae bacterium]|nr:replicative helicase loader/inhibitor [Oscillospiraceae bacterium]
MTIKETGLIMDILKAAYPTFYKGQSNADLTGAAKLWAVMFSDDNAEIVAMAVKSFIATDAKGFPPAIGMIKNKIAEFVGPEKMTEYEAWNLVKKAVSNGIYGAGEEFAKLPPILQRLVGSADQIHEWARSMTSETLESVVGSNFMRSYRARAEYEREYFLLPCDVKDFIGALSERPAMPEAPQAVTEHELNERRNHIHRQLKEA